VLMMMMMVMMRNIADVTRGIVGPSQSISCVSTVSPLAAFYDINRRTIEMLFFCSVGTRNNMAKLELR
jgi:hypothetical protein